MARIPFLAASGIAALIIPPAQVAIAADYMSIEAAQRGLFAQAERFDEVVLALNTEQKQSVTQLAGPQPPHRSLRAWKAMRGTDVLGYVFVDEVLGRQDMITYAVGIDATGKLSAIDVLSYRESHGGEIRGTAWRNQFDGRQGLDHLRFGTDIKNIAGATLSCEHVTQGVRWVTALWQVTLRAVPATAAAGPSTVVAPVAADGARRVGGGQAAAAGTQAGAAPALVAANAAADDAPAPVATNAAAADASAPVATNAAAADAPAPVAANAAADGAIAPPDGRAA